ncbi:MAG: tRNA (adenosine(37)-N6)-threonylcarbamoyltransferase complex ATPase subunit type 1 TsaE [Oscillospiraceae bacterium]|nr:tRNA (adenosine(37)-N6)-threonylcarbamoyltransferase complex ATPase subunit type 1 TsaE [Oscillospiraceae bacterium]
MQINTTNSVEETFESGKAFSTKLSRNAAVLLYGEMGAGKTHFVKGIAVGLGITVPVTSPTFSLVNEYSGLIHFDLFRIYSEDDLYAIGFYDYIGKGVLAIEWAENIPGLKDEFDEYYTVRIEKTGDDDEQNERRITIDYSGA